MTFVLSMLIREHLMFLSCCCCTKKVVSCYNTAIFDDTEMKRAYTKQLSERIYKQTRIKPDPQFFSGDGRMCANSGYHVVVFFYSSLTAAPSEKQCLSSGAYEWPVLVSLKHAVALSQHNTAGMVQRKPQ